MSRLSTSELVTIVKQFALDHYNDPKEGWWDLVVETMTDDDIAEVIKGSFKSAGALYRMSKHLRPIHAHREEQRSIARAEADVPSFPTLTPKSLDLFLALANDAGNWSGTPLLGGNVPSDRSTRGNLTHLKKAGLVDTSTDEENRVWVSFTTLGQSFAAHQGVVL